MTNPTAVEQTNQHSQSQELDQPKAQLQNRVGPRGRGLILRGRSRSYYGKQLAQHAVMEAVILPIVANEIEMT